MSKSVGVFNAKNNFTAILKEVANGETVNITKHGKPIASIVPYNEVPTNAAKAVEEIRKLSKRVALKNVNIRQMIEQGRK